MNTEDVACEIVNIILSDLALNKYLIASWYEEKNSRHTMIVEDRLVEKVKNILDKNA